jgi:hypothetical protein
MEARELARARARRAYEIGQLRAATILLAPAAAVIALAALLHDGGMPTALAPLAIALAVAIVGFGWRGGAWRRGAPVGLIAGLPGLLLPRLVLAKVGHCAACAPLDVSAATCFLYCGGAGLIAGLAVGALAARDESPLRFAAAAVVIACLTAALTCVIAGLAGVTGIAAGLVVSTAPAIVRARHV